MPFLGVILLAGILGFFFGWRKAAALEKRLDKPLHSRPGHHAMALALSLALPMLGIFIMGSAAAHYHVSSTLQQHAKTLPGGIEELELWKGPLYACVTQPEAFSCPDHVATLAPVLNESLHNADGVLAAVMLVTALLGGAWGWRRIGPEVRARQAVERVGRLAFAGCALVSVLVTLGILGSVSFEAWRFFQKVPAIDFLFGLHWSPQIALRADQAGASGSFGMIPLFAGTLLITLIAMLIAVPVGVLSAVYLVEYADRRFRDVAKPVLEMLAGVPTVVYGYFAVITVAPLLKGAGAMIGLDVASESALAAGIVMGVMIIPFVSSLSDDVIHAIPQSLRDGSLGLGATKSETILRVVLPAAMPGIVSAVLLAVSRAVGETMIVVMAAGMSANLTLNPLAAVTTVTVQIVSLLVGDQEFDSPKTLAAFALGLVLFIITLLLNIVALRIVRRYREKYA